MIVVNVVARMRSKRLPNKPAYELGGKPAFVHVFERCQEFLPNADHYFLSTTVESIDDPLALLAKAYGYEVFRHVPSKRGREMALIQHVGLKPDDIFFIPLADEPLAFFEYIPFGIQGLEETGQNYFRPLLKEHTLLWGVGANEQALFTVEGYLKLARNRLRRHVEGHIWQNFSVLRPLFCSLPEELMQPWPWGPLYLDHIPQAIQLKDVYDALYRGKAIDVRDVYKLMQEWPLMAGLGGTAPVAADPFYPGGAYELEVKEMEKFSDCKYTAWHGK